MALPDQRDLRGEELFAHFSSQTAIEAFKARLPHLEEGQIRVVIESQKDLIVQATVIDYLPQLIESKLRSI